MMEQIKISVRNLVEFILRSGNIDNRHGVVGGKEAMQEGGRIHRKIQRRMGTSYHAEVALKIQYEYENYILVVEGRADGIIIESQQVTIDEIKGIYQDVHSLSAPIPIHLAQARCYAYIYGSQQELKEITVQMTYCNLDTEEIRYFYEQYQMEELHKWFSELIKAYKKWADFQFVVKKKRQESIQGLEFPFPYREGQRDLVIGVYRTISRQKNLFIQAPTGTGKTISTIFPAIRGVGEGFAEKIFYLTAKTITRTVAKEAFDMMRSRGYSGSVLMITAKEKLCLCEEMECNPVNCFYAAGHYDRVNEAVFDLIQKEKVITREILLEQAKAYKVCPFEMCLDTALWIDNIICDYNYVFDPNVYLKRFFAEGTKGEYIFLIDEAHNLVERGREMYSAVLYKESFLEMKKLFNLHSMKIVKNLEKCNKFLLEMKRECENYQVLDNIGHLIFALMNLGASMDEFLQKNIDIPEKKRVLEFYLELRHFLNMYDRLDENYVIYTQHIEDGRFMLKLYCVNPSVNLQECLNKGRSAIFFSATLLPIQYYKGLLSTKGDNYAVYAKTVFKKEQSMILVANDVSSKYTRRNKEEFQQIAYYIQVMVQAKKGNYIVFFPSYKLLEQVMEEWLEIDSEGKEYAVQKSDMNRGEKEDRLEIDSKRVEYVIQTPNMNEQEREKFLEEFSVERENSLVGFCILGGIFSEGIDLKNEQLIGTLVVGTGLPQISNEREILKDYYNQKNGAGFDYAFRYPGMNKVMQAAGRVIRTVQDKGVILLLDERFLQYDYQMLFPKEWEDYKVCNKNNIERLLQEFWI